MSKNYAGRIAYDQNHRVGTSEKLKSGQTAQYVDIKDFYKIKLWHSHNIFAVFIGIALDILELSDEEILELDNAVADEYWTRHQGVLTPVRVLRHLSLLQHQTGGSKVIGWTEEWLETIGRGRTYGDAKKAHALARSAVVIDVLKRQITPHMLATCEFMADLLLLQRAMAEDIRVAEKQRGTEEPRGKIIAKMFDAHKTLFEETIAYVTNPSLLLPALTEEGQDAALKIVARRVPELHLKGILPKD